MIFFILSRKTIGFYLTIGKMIKLKSFRNPYLMK